MSKEIEHKVSIYCDGCGRDLSRYNYLRLKWRFVIFRYWKNFDENGHSKNLPWDICFECIDEIGKKVRTHTKLTEEE